MNTFKTFVTDSLEKYDKNMKEQDKLLKDATYYRIINMDNNTENDKIIFFDKDNKEIISYNYQIISSYRSDFNIWSWGWAIPHLKNKWTRIITKILNYGFSLEPTNNYHLKLELINSKFVVSDPIQIDIHLSIASGLSKINNIYPIILPIQKKKANLFEKFQKLSEDKNSIDGLIIKNIDEFEDVKIFYLFLFNQK
jgi:hypothetical protein